MLRIVKRRARLGHDRRGSLRSSQQPNGAFSWQDFNPDGSLAALYNRHGTLSGSETSVPADASPLADFAYSSNLDGQKTQEIRSGGGLTTETSSYGYDNLGRLNQVMLPDGTNRSHSYDLDSNRSQVVENAATVAATRMTLQRPAASTS